MPSRRATADGVVIGSDGKPVLLADNMLSDLFGFVKNVVTQTLRCQAGPCSDAPYRDMIDIAQNHVSAGVQGEFSVVAPQWIHKGGGLGTFGLNLQLNLGGLSESGIYVYVPRRQEGWSVGPSIGINVAAGKGPWSGLFNNAAVGYGPWSVGAFASPGWDEVGPGWAGVSFGISAPDPPVNLSPVQGSTTQTNYIPIIGQ
jgi:hypothetical protein